MLKIQFMLFSAIFIFFLPGYLITRLCLKKENDFSIIALSLALSIVLIPIASFAIAIALGTIIQKNLLFSIATVINVTCVILFGKQKK